MPNMQTAVRTRAPRAPISNRRRREDRRSGGGLGDGWALCSAEMISPVGGALTRPAAPSLTPSFWVISTGMKGAAERQGGDQQRTEDGFHGALLAAVDASAGWRPTSLPGRRDARLVLSWSSRMIPHRLPRLSPESSRTNTDDR